MRQRRTWAALCLLLAAAAAAALAGCTAGGYLGGEGSVECDPSPTITSAPTTVATAGTGYGYLATGYYFCFLGLSFSIEGVELPTGASVSSPVVTWTPGPDQAGRVLIVDGNPHLWCELYDPAAGTFSITGAVKRWRPNFAAVALS